MKHPTEAPIRLADGKVFVGSFHGHALEKAELGFSHSDGAAFYEAETLLVS
jgi:hypothetical protein